MKAVEMLDTTTGEVVETFRSVREAARYVVDVLGYKRKVANVAETIYKSCNGKVCKAQYYGYCWRYPAYAKNQYTMPTTKQEIYDAVEHGGTNIDLWTEPNGATYTIVKSAVSGEYVVSCAVIDERDHFMIDELSFKEFDDAYAVWATLGKAAPSLFIQDDDALAE